jgi:hypothetical protein
MKDLQRLKVKWQQDRLKHLNKKTIVVQCYWGDKPQIQMKEILELHQVTRIQLLITTWSPLKKQCPRMSIPLSKATPNHPQVPREALDMDRQHHPREFKVQWVWAAQDVMDQRQEHL